jgi:alkylation response protein AidB-like acyl-CoA dehydrogenase
MVQPKNFDFGEEEVMLRDSVRKFFENNLPTDKLHAMVAANPDPDRAPECLWDKDLWGQMVELGWTMLAVPEQAGGMGMKAVAVAALAEEAGRAALPSPLISTINSSYVLAACNSAAANEALGRIVEGTPATLAVTNCRGSWESTDTDVRVENGKLEGAAWFVQDAGKADFFVVKARANEGIGLYIVPADAEGVTIVADAITDLTRDQAHVEFRGVDAGQVAAAPGSGDRVLDQAEPAILIVLAADMCGAAEWQLQTTVEYATVRTQFDKPIGFFQAIKHPLVELMVMLDQARSLVYNAACAIDCEPESAERYARMAKSSASDAAAFACTRSVQTHGGIGFTWECFVHLYFKRQKHNQALMGDGVYQRAKLADIMMGPIGA